MGLYNHPDLAKALDIKPWSNRAGSAHTGLGEFGVKPGVGPSAPLMPRHVRVGFRRYSALQGIDLTPLRTWRGRVISMEALVTKLVNSLRQNGFRPFRPLEESVRPNDSLVESRVTGLRDFNVRFRLPWQPGRVTCALSIELKGKRLLQKKLHGFSSQGHQVVFDATVDVAAGVAIFRGRRWKTLRRANYDSLIRDAVDSIIEGLKATAAPVSVATGSLFQKPDVETG